MKFWDDVCRGPFVPFLNFTDCLYQVPDRIYSHSKLPLRCEVVENRYSFWTPFFAGWRTPKFLRQFVIVIYPYGTTVWLVEFYGLKCVWCEARGNEEKRRIFGGWVKTPVLFLPLAKVHEILRQCRELFLDSNAVSRLSISCSSSEILAVKTAIEFAKSSKR